MAPEPSPEYSARHPKQPKVAIVHDWLNTRVGGAERVLLELAKLYPEAPVYTLVFDRSKFAGLIDPSRVRTSRLQRLPAALRRRPRWLLPLIPRAIEAFDFSRYDLVISSSGAWSKNIITSPRTLHICYCHSPARFLWDYSDRYLEEIGINRLVRPLVEKLLARIRAWDRRNASRVDYWLANSRHVAARIKRYFGQSATVMYPPVDLPAETNRRQREDYYLVLSTLTEYKKIDAIITAFNASGRPLTVVGEGPQLANLKRLAKPNITFTGRVNETNKWDLLAGARGLIMAHEEDFGITPVEAMAAGTPAVALSRGGARETINHGVTGILFDKPTPAAINQAVERADHTQFDPAKLQSAAARFSTARWRSEFKQFVVNQLAHHDLMHPHRRLSVLDVPVNVATSADIRQFTHQAMATPRVMQTIATINTEFIMMAERDPDFARVLNATTVNVPDGIGLLWATYFLSKHKRGWLAWLASIAAIVLRPRRLRRQMPERVTGVDLTHELAAEAARHGWKLFLLGLKTGLPQAPEKAAKRLRVQYPGLKIAGTAYKDMGGNDDDQLVKQINTSGADILLVALGPPAQEQWIIKHQHELTTARMAMGVGGTFDYIAGTRRRAPAWLQAVGLEWLWRLARSPRRLKRQLAIPRFMLKVYKSRHK